MLNLRATVAAALLVALAAPIAEAAEPAPPVPAQGGGIHHWGLQGESAPHHGWARYGRLTLDIGGERYYVYNQAADEFSVAVVERASGTIKIRAISIPGAGLFYSPAGTSPCEPDTLERMGLYAELLLFYLSSAFPAGPASVDKPSSEVVDAPIPELHFMQGLMKPREGARTSVAVSPVNRSTFEYVMRDDIDNIKGIWQADQPRAVIPNDEALLGWRTCWAGAWSTGADGARSFRPRIVNAASLKTFGDVRKALQQARRPGGK